MRQRSTASSARWGRWSRSSASRATRGWWLATMRHAPGRPRQQQRHMLDLGGRQAAALVPPGARGVHAHHVERPHLPHGLLVEAKLFGEPLDERPQRIHHANRGRSWLPASTRVLRACRPCTNRAACSNCSAVARCVRSPGLYIATPGVGASRTAAAHLQVVRTEVQVGQMHQNRHGRGRRGVGEAQGHSIKQAAGRVRGWRPARACRQGQKPWLLQAVGSAMHRHAQVDSAPPATVAAH